jgi:aryl-alcohol dehydrogenase-like predicted oxidoreductase
MPRKPHKIATKCNTDSSTVALAWLKSQTGVIGSRTLEQLNANFKVLDFTLRPEQITSLNNVSKPVLNFPADFLAQSLSYVRAGATVTAIPSQLTLGQ